MITTSFFAQNNSDKIEIRQVIQTFFDALEQKDSLLMKSVTHRESQIWRIYPDEDPPRYNMRFEKDDLPSMHSMSDVKEIGLDISIHIHRNIAVAWVPYEFYIEDKFSHCGVDIFNLFKEENGWKIISAAYSVEKTKCDELKAANN